MDKKRIRERQAAARSHPANVVFTGAVCLALGLGIGYYFGQQTPSHAGLSAPVQPSAPLANPSAFVQSETNLKSILRSNPEDLNALINLGNLYYDHGRFQDAVEWYGRALELDPDNPNVRTDRGTSYWNLEQPELAIAEFHKSLEVEPAHPQTLYNLGVVYLYGMHNIAEARKAWERLLETNPNHPDRAKIQEQIRALSPPSVPQGNQAGAGESGSMGVEDLLKRIKSKQ